MKKILIIQKKMIGDVLASTIVCEQLKKHYPKAHVHFLIDENTKAVVVGNPFIDQMIIFKKKHRKNITTFFSFLKWIRKQRYDLTIDLLCKTESSLITITSMAPIRISYPKWYSKFCYTITLKHSQKKATDLGTAIDNRLLLLNPILKKYDYDHLEPKIYLTKHERKEAFSILETNQLTTGKPILMLGVLGSGPLKTYPLDYLAQLIDLITANYEVEILLNYIPTQRTQIDVLLSKCSDKSKRAIAKNVYGKSLREFLALLSHCHGYIGNEGGASHMAKALGIPNFSIFAPWISKEAWLTYKKNPSNQAVHLKDYHPKAVLTASKKERKRRIPENYKLFKPDLFSSKLVSFIHNEIIAHQ